MGKLKILKASAGSGKTHYLTQEYLRLLLKDENAYRHILAVTFTNKATDEMKRRILETLYRMSVTDDRAKQRLVSILHDYSHFSISTIDKFFQQTMRAFAREIGKNVSYSVELDQNMVLSEATDQMILSLDKEENSELLDWLISFSFDRIEEGKAWNIKNDINNLSRQIFQETFKIKNGEFGERFTDKNVLASYNTILDKIIVDFQQDLSNIGNNAVDLIKGFSLELDDFKGGTRSPLNYFKKIAEGETNPPSETFINLYGDSSLWYTKTLTKTNPSLVGKIENAYNHGLNDLVGEVVEMMTKRRVDYQSASEIRKNIYTLGILLDINKYIQQYSRENNIVLISETTELLNRIIDGTDTPFIYERVGNRIDNFMLDEFQDTSVMQWENFRPLIRNSLASGHDNLIVGDVKQSIYRWRGSEWNLLSNDIYNEFDKEQISDNDLIENWRSGENIVEFNNKLFSYASELCDSLLEDGDKNVSKAYSSVCQTIPEQRRDKKGHVRLQFVERDEKEGGWHKSALEQISEYLKRLRELGYRYKDIAFLVRKKDEGVEVMNHLIENGYPVISDEALLISSSQMVTGIISQLKYLNNPNDGINNTIAEFENFSLQNDRDLERLPLYEMCEVLVSRFHANINDSESAMVQGFLDVVLDYVKTNRSDLASFLEWWDSNGKDTSLSSPQGQDAIRVMTIHKAKGLGVEVAIIPFMDMPLDHSPKHKNIIWCEPKSAPFDRLPFVPVIYGKALQDTIFKEDYLKERQKAFVDNLNTAYVALTRSKQELLVFASKPKKEQSVVDSVAGIMYSFFKDNLDENLSVDFGEWCSAKTDNEEQVNEIPVTDFISIPIGDRLKLSLNSADFFDDSSKRNYGLIMHDILSRVYSEDDLQSAVKESLIKGEINNADYEPLIGKLEGMISKVKEYNWFDARKDIYNEIEIVEPHGKICRPDRVMIREDCATVVDFKFGVKKPSHSKQVGRYMALIQQMGLKNVKGYLWYPENNVVESVNPLLF